MSYNFRASLLWMLSSLFDSIDIQYVLENEIVPLTKLFLFSLAASLYSLCQSVRPSVSNPNAGFHCENTYLSVCQPTKDKSFLLFLFFFETNEHLLYNALCPFIYDFLNICATLLRGCCHSCLLSYSKLN